MRGGTPHDNTLIQYKMEKTNNSIIVNEFVGIHYEDVPVMRNGKATKRTKQVRVYDYAELKATGYLYNGHEIFLLDKDAENEEMDFISTYRADGTRLTCMCQYGRYGQADHETTCDYYKKSKVISTHSSGYQGPTGMGWGASIKRINW